MHEHLLLGLAAVLVCGVGAQWLAWRLRLPSILLLLVVGFVVGPGLGWVNPDELLGDLLFPLVSAFVAIILFEGGLSLRLKELAEAGRTVRNLMVIGVVVTWIGCGIASWWILGLDPRLAAVFGALLTVTGPTVTVPLLRFVRPRGRVGSIIKWEGIVNDPVGAVLAVLLFEGLFFDVEGTAAFVAVGALKTILYGGVIGAFLSWLLIFLLERHWIPDLLHNSFAIALAVGGFALANHFQHEAGLLTVTVIGVALANQKRVSVKHIVEFKEAIGVLLLAVLFVLLAARVDPAELDLRTLAPPALGFLAAFVLVIRPLATFLSTIASGLNWKERVLLGWMAPKGIVAAAVASVFALRLDASAEVSGTVVAGADVLVPNMFIVIIGTVAVYGLTLAPLARRLGLAHPNPQGILIVGASLLGRSLAVALKEEGFRSLLVDTNWDQISAARMEGLETFYGNALAEFTHEEIDLDRIGRVFAMTPNDEVNSLSALHYSEEFGRAEVYRLAMTDGSAPRMEKMRHGRLLFDRQLTFDALEERLRAGARIRRTPITAEFDFGTHASHYAWVLPLFVVTESKTLVVSADGAALETKPGQTLVALVAERTGDGV